MTATAVAPESTAIVSQATPTSKVMPTSEATPTLEATPTSKVTFGRVAKSEWLKFRTVRSNTITIASAAAAAVGFGTLFSSLAGSGDGPSSIADNALSLSLGGFQLSQIIVAILGVSLVAGEYQTGLMRSWFGAAPDRLRVLGAKLGVYGSIVFVISLLAAVTAFLVGQTVLPASFTALTLGSAGVTQALLGTAFYSACIALMGIGLGFLLRSTAAGAGAVVTTLMIAPIMVNLLPTSIGDPIANLLPSNAATAVQGLAVGPDAMSAAGGIAVLLSWVVVIVGCAAVSLKRRDA